MKKWVVSVVAVISLALSCIALSACSGGNTSADYLGKWQFQSLTETDGTEYKKGDFYRGDGPQNELMAESFSLEIRETELGYEGKKLKMFQLRNWVGYPSDLQETVIGSWTFNKTKITLEGTNSNSLSRTYSAVLKDGVLSIEYSGVYTVYLVKA